MLPLPCKGGAGGGCRAARLGRRRQPGDATLRADAPTPNPSLKGRGEKGLSYTPEPAEEALATALDAAEPRAAQAVAAEEFEGAMAALATLRVPIDAFFDEVTVNDPDQTKRAARLGLLARMRDAVHARRRLLEDRWLRCGA